MIPEGLYRQIISVIPVICVDIVVRNKDNKFLLANRKNEPLKGEWWLIGGRIKHGEAAKAACSRKLFEELNLKVDKFCFIGFYQDYFDRNSFTNQNYHTFSLVFEVLLDGMDGENIKLDPQHSEWGWFDKLPERFQLTSVSRSMSL